MSDLTHYVNCLYDDEAIKLLRDLRTQGFSLKIRTNQIIVKPCTRLTDEQRQALRMYKDELMLAILAEQEAQKWLIQCA